MRVSMVSPAYAYVCISPYERSEVISGAPRGRTNGKWTWLQKLFGTSPTDAEAPDVHLKATSQTALARALHRLKSGQRGWVTIAQAGPLFSADDTNPLGEMDDDGRRALEIFAAKQRHRSTPTLERSTRRIYFTRL